MLGLPTTGGSRALVDHRPRLDSRVAAGMRRAGAVMLGKANLDEFPFGDFGISTVGGTIGNAFDPTLSTSGSSGGTATAVATSLATLGFGTDTCNSLSNPASFASLATIRTTRGLDQPRRRDAAQHLSGCRRSDREVGPRARAGARPGHRPRRRGRGDGRRRAAHRRLVRRRARCATRSRARASACSGSCSSASPASARPPPTMENVVKELARGRRDHRRRRRFRTSTPATSRRAAARPGR